MAPEIKNFEAYESEAEAFLKPKFVSRYGMMRFQDLDEPGDELDFFVEDILTSGDKSVVAGPSQSGKSFVAIHLGMAIARGTDFFGKKVKQGLVIYQAGEGARGIKNRMKAYREHNSIAANEDVPFVLLRNKVNIFLPENDVAGLIEEINAIKEIYKQFPLRAVFLDTLSKAMTGANENDGRDVGLILSNVDRIVAGTGAHVSLVHHLNADGSKLRGHTSLFADMDTVLSVVVDTETKIRRLSLGKQKDGDLDGLSMNFELMSLKVGEREGKDITSCVVVKQGEKDEFKNEGGEKPFRASPGETMFLQALLRALAENSVPPPPDVNCPTNIGAVVDWSEVKHWFKRMNVRGDADSSKESNRISQALKRARESMLTNGVIGSDRPSEAHPGWIWLTGKPVWGIRETYSKRYKVQKPAAAPKQHKTARPDDLDIPF